MLGAIIGDVVGSVYEFNNTKDYHFKLFTAESDYTDDSILTLAVAQWAMNDASLSHSELERTFVEFASKDPNPKGGYGGGFSTWLFSPSQLTSYHNGAQLSGRHPYNSWGNGSAMRVSAIGWLFDTLEKTEEAAALSASITHNHPEGIKGAQAVASSIFLARTGKTKLEIKRYIEERYGYQLDVTWKYLNATYSWDSSCQGTVPQALAVFLESSDFEDSIRKAVSIGGDSDTLACITGAVAEAFYQDIPSEMVKPVLDLLPVRFLNLLEQFSHSAYKDCYDRYICV